MVAVAIAVAIESRIPIRFIATEFVFAVVVIDNNYYFNYLCYISISFISA